MTLCGRLKLNPSKTLWGELQVHTCNPSPGVAVGSRRGKAMLVGPMIGVKWLKSPGPITGGQGSSKSGSSKMWGREEASRAVQLDISVKNSSGGAH